jgi:superfamily II DNA or RNA helicase
VCLVLSDRVAHCRTLVELLSARGVIAAMLTGDLPAADRRKVVEALNGWQIKVLVATGQLIGEGFDCRELSTLFLTTPIKFKGRLIQYLGRVLRPAPGKAAQCKEDDPRKEALPGGVKQLQWLLQWEVGNG